jgi:hypothetical protein
MLHTRTPLKSIAFRLQASWWQGGSGKTAVGLPILAAAMILATGCSANADNTIDVAFDTNFQLRVSQSASVSGEGLEVGFQAVTSDSRCGKGEVCVWEGDAVVRIWLQLAGEAKQERELHTGSKEPNAADHAGYDVILVSLSPTPISGQSIPPTKYVAILQITRGLSGDRNIF